MPCQSSDVILLTCQMAVRLFHFPVLVAANLDILVFHLDVFLPLPYQGEARSDSLAKVAVDWNHWVDGTTA